MPEPKPKPEPEPKLQPKPKPKRKSKPLRLLSWRGVLVCFGEIHHRGAW
jgi:hypothetical protein